MTTVITIAQQKGGAGKSTIAAHLAIALTQKTQKVALIDIDPQGSLKCWHQIREQKFGEGYTGITFCHIGGWKINNEISRLANTHDYIIIDSPPHTQTEAKAAIRAADLVLIPMQASPTDFWATDATLEICCEENKLAKILMNRFNPTSKIAKELALEQHDLFNSHIGNRVIFATAMFKGLTVLETDSKSIAALEIKNLTDEIHTLTHPQLVQNKITEEA